MAPHEEDQQKAASRKRSQPEKDSEEYKAKRERNNVAVRKSRAKAKEKNLEREEEVKCLLERNAVLKMQVETITKEMDFIRSLHRPEDHVRQVPKPASQQERKQELHIIPVSSIKKEKNAQFGGS